MSNEDGVFFDGEGFLEEEGVGDAGVFLGAGERRTGVSPPPKDAADVSGMETRSGAVSDGVTKPGMAIGLKLLWPEWEEAL